MKIVIYSPTCCSKPIRLWLFFKTQIKIFFIKPEIFPFRRRSNKVIKVISGFIKNILIYVVKIIFQALLVCRDMRVSKWWQNNCFGVNYSFKGILHPKMKIWSFITYPHIIPNPQKLCLSSKHNYKVVHKPLKWFERCRRGSSVLVGSSQKATEWLRKTWTFTVFFSLFFWIITNWTRIYWKYLFIGKEDTF